MKFAYTIIYVGSVAETLAFYENAFGFRRRFLHDTGSYGELESGDTVLGIASRDLGRFNFGDDYEPVSPGAKPPGVVLVFVDEDVHAAYGRACAAGAASIQAPTELPWGQTVAYVRSLEGTVVELCTPLTLPARETASADC